MKIEYRETTDDLLTRIDIHQKYGGRNIDQWMLEVLQLQKDMHILDVGCGAGKQCFVFDKALGGEAEITGGDISVELLEKARQENRVKAGGRVKFIELDFDKRFPFEDDRFDLLSACFTIYYMSDIPFTVGEMHRVLKPEGRLFTSGPMPDNKRVFYDIIREATGKQIPPMPGSSRYGTQILDMIKATFSKVEVHIFENPLTFESFEPFIAYTQASLSEDRKLWKSLFDDKAGFERVIAQITDVAARRIAKDGPIVMTKVVGGFVATK